MEVLAIVRNDACPGIDDRVVQAREGDFSAFEGLYHDHVGRIFALCVRMTADRAVAEELTQVTFVRAWERLDSIRGDADLTSWLRAIALNVVLGHRRARGRREGKETPLEAVAPFPGPAPERSEAATLRLDLEQAVARLPERARRVFVLHDVEGFRHGEIARLLGVTSGTSKAQLHRARRLLREALRS